MTPRSSQLNVPNQIRGGLKPLNPTMHLKGSSLCRCGKRISGNKDQCAACKAK